MYKTAIITISDRCAAGQMTDDTTDVLRNALTEEYDLQYCKVIPDEEDLIKQELIQLCDNNDIDLILTNGGTGFGPRDVTPEATLDVITRSIPGIPELMRAKGAQNTTRSYLSRAVAGIRGSTIIVNLPGSPRGAKESLESIKEVLAHSIEMMKGEGH